MVTSSKGPPLKVCAEATSKLTRSAVPASAARFRAAAIESPW